MSTNGPQTIDAPLRPARETPRLKLPIPGDAGPADYVGATGELADRIDAAAAFFMPGDLKASAARTAPAGWLPCDGRAVSRETYPDLFTAIGEAYGAGDGQDTFNVPNLVGRVARCDPANLGQAGGADTVALTAEQMPSHAHGVYDPTHAHSVADGGHAHYTSTGGHSHTVGNLADSAQGALLTYSGGLAGHGSFTAPGVGTQGTSYVGDLGGATDARGVGVGIYGSYTGIQTYAAGSSWAHENRPPYLNVNYFIKT